VALGATVARGSVWAADEAEIARLKQAIFELQKRLDDLEKQSKAQSAAVVEAKNKDKIKIDGRVFVSVVDAEAAGTNAGRRAYQIPDGKLRFTYAPSDNLEITTRLRMGQDGMLGTQTVTVPAVPAVPAAAATVPVNVQLIDYFYADFKQVFRNSDATLRVGRLKADIGEETFTDNPVEAILINNSVPIVAGYDEGIQLFGTTKGRSPVRYSVGMLNDSAGTGASLGSPGANFKLSGNADAAKRVYLSGSYYRTDDMPAANTTEVRVGGLGGAPAGAVQWRRNLREVDATLNYQGGNPPYGGYGRKGAFGGRLSYGQVSDSALGGGVDRDGDYWHVEGLVNLSPAAYLAARYSELSLDRGATATIAGVPAANGVSRLQIGLGYRLSPLAVAKLEYMLNDEKRAAGELNNDALTLGVSAKF
jgi:hypothetical protein